MRTQRYKEYMHGFLDRMVAQQEVSSGTANDEEIKQVFSFFMDLGKSLHENVKFRTFPRVRTSKRQAREVYPKRGIYNRESEHKPVVKVAPPKEKKKDLRSRTSEFYSRHDHEINYRHSSGRVTTHESSRESRVNHV